jgi:ribosomal protein S27AE
MSCKDFFFGRKITIATMHKKEWVIAPLLEKHFGMIAVVPEEFNTDQFGTFTREIKRAGSQLEAARKKAFAAMEIAGTELAVSSEGSFGAHPSVPFVQSNLELVLFVDKKNGLEIKGHYRTTETNIDGVYAANILEIIEFAKKIGFPEHGVILRQSENGHFGIYKNLRTEDEIVQQAQKMFSYPFTRKIFIETDMRAHRNPTRMKAIEKATEDLIKNLSALCPKCHAPGFVIFDFEKGLPCSLCKIPTNLPLQDIYRCEKCGFTEKKRVTKYGESANPQHCDYCNP